jgi:hypothetical protein
LDAASHTATSLKEDNLRLFEKLQYVQRYKAGDRTNTSSDRKQEPDIVVNIGDTSVTKRSAAYVSFRLLLPLPLVAQLVDEILPTHLTCYDMVMGTVRMDGTIVMQWSVNMSSYMKSV